MALNALLQFSSKFITFINFVLNLFYRTGYVSSEDRVLSGYHKYQGWTWPSLSDILQLKEEVFKKLFSFPYLEFLKDSSFRILKRIVAFF